MKTVIANIPHNALRKKESFFHRLSADLIKNKLLYLMILPGVIYYAIFCYWPMYGVVLAFKRFSPSAGIMGSKWIAFDNFIRFFSGYNALSIIGNTLEISLYCLVFGFPIPILFAVLLNYLRGKRFKKTLQMVSYAPHFISTVVICGMITIFLQPDTGVINAILKAFGGESVSFLSNPHYFKAIYVITNIWQSVGWGSIIYMSALSGVSYDLHEAAMIDGASKIKRIIHIDIPSILPTVVMMFILQVGQTMNVGFEKIMLLQNDLNRSASDVISLYVYRMGLINNDYGYSTAVGLFNSVVNIILLLSVNWLSKKIAKNSLW